MVELLARIFIKNHKNVTDEKVRTSYGTMAGIVGIISNVCLVIIKLTIGIISMSISIIADAINNLSDMGSSVLTLIGFKISSKPADKEHPFGHQRVEYITGLLIAMIIAFVGIELLTKSIEKVITPEEVSSSLITYILLGVSILIKVGQGMFYVNTSKRIKSLSLKASAKDSFNDCITTSVVLVGTIVSKYINYNLDGILGIIVSLFIIVSAIGLIKDAMSPLIGEKPDKKVIDSIVNKVKSYDGILGVHDVIAHLYGPSKIFISLHAEVDSKTDVLITHDLIDNIEHDVKEEFDVQLVIHMDPIVVGDQEVDELKSKITAIVEEIGNDLKMHDFRMVKGNSHTNLIFDVVIPYQFKLSDEAVIEKIKEEVKKINDTYICVINIDRDYVSE